MLIYTHQRSKRKKNNSKKFAALQQQHSRFLASHGITGKKKRKVKSHVSFPDLSVSSQGVAPVSNQIPGYGFKRTVDDYKWRAGREEKPEVIAETERKKKCIAPAFNKGPIMYITEDADKTSLGRKV